MITPCAFTEYMVKTKRVRDTLIQMLSDHDTLNTMAIYDKLNDRQGKYGSRNGCGLRRLTNVLSKDPLFLDLGFVQVRGIYDDDRNVLLWGLNNSLMNNLGQGPE